MVPGIKDGFDRVDCALEASALGLPPARSVDPLPTAVPALPPAPAGVPVLAGGPPGLTMAASARPQLLVGANLALLAAAAAATIYLWLRVFGPDAGLLSFPAASASPAFERSTVAATIDLSPAPATRPQPESMVAGGGSQPASPALAATGEDGATLVSNTSKPRRARQDGGPVVRPSPPAPPPAPPAEPEPTRSAPVPTFPVPTSPPGDRVPGPSLPGGGGGGNPEQPDLPGSGAGTRG